MFGHQDEAGTAQEPGTESPSDTDQAVATNDNATEDTSTAPNISPDYNNTGQEYNTAQAEPTTDSSASQLDDSTTDSDNNATANEETSSPVAPTTPDVEATPAPGADITDDSSPDNTETSASDNGIDQISIADNGLLEIKKQALDELSPLVSHLDQSPEEKFKTTMMMIQAADNQNLVPDAYKAAKNITDEKARAQALLDIVNEINYFTHKK